ncbi:MAG: CRISPR-associated protein Csx20 [Thermodesulfobacteriota bacterium]
MAGSLYLLFNHQLTDIQKADAHASLAVQCIIDLPLDLKQLWRQMPPDMPEIDAYLAPIKAWLSEQTSSGDYVLIQGDFGACYIMVNFAFELGLVPVYSTTRREALENHEPDGAVSLRHQFRHRIYRKYEA